MKVAFIGFVLCRASTKALTYINSLKRLIHLRYLLYSSFYFTDKETDPFFLDLTGQFLRNAYVEVFTYMCLLVAT